LVTLGQTTWAQLGFQKFGGRWAPPPWNGGIGNLNKRTPPRHCYISNLVALRQNIWTLVGVTKIWWDAEAPPLRMGCSWPPRNMLLPTCVKFGHSGSNHSSVITELSQKNLTSASCLSRSLKVNGIDTVWLATC